jgi:hypothetical protein
MGGKQTQQTMEQLRRVISAELERRFPSDIGDAEIHELAVWAMKEHPELSRAAIEIWIQNAN